MSRSRTALTAWPAFADLMTILAVVGLLAAVVLLSELSESYEQFEKAQAEIAAKDFELAALAARVGALEQALDTQKTEGRLRAELALKEARGIDSPPCLGKGDDGQPKPLLQIAVRQGYELRRRWLPSDEDLVKNIPGLNRAVSLGQVTVDIFKEYAGAIYRYGDGKDNAFGGSCRFFVVLRKETDSAAEFVNAFSVVTRYFFIANPSEVIPNLAIAE